MASQRSTLGRLDYLAQEGGTPSARQLVADSVDTVVFIKRTTQGRRVTELLGVQGLAPDGEYQTVDLMEEHRCSSAA